MHRRVLLLVATSLPESLEDIVLIRRDDELAHRQAESLGIVACKDIAKVSSRHCELDFVSAGTTVRARQADPRVEVVDNLREDPSPVNSVDRTEPVRSVEV